MTQETFETKSTLVDNLRVIELDVNERPGVHSDPAPPAVHGVDIEECDLKTMWVDVGGWKISSVQFISITNVSGFMTILICQCSGWSQLSVHHYLVLDKTQLPWR